ncbi:MAG: hypothetical protein KKD18_02970 [Nanoarchaeota archaeon]|nr:hypothetical protein [Nanoarchaeota archaeon]MBU0977352.1 hypothetical protein [Nanoarchaeota archaeon]
MGYEETLIIDEFDALQKEKLRVEEKIKGLRGRIIALAKEENKNFFFGSSKVCSVKEFIKIVYPEDKELLIRLIKQKGLYDSLSSLNYFKLGPKILRNEIDKEIIDMTRREKNYRVSLKDKTEIVVG